MKRYIFYSVIIFPLLSLLSCHKNNNTSIVVDDKSYIRNFELTQKNPRNDTTIRIFSPKAIINPNNNDVEIIDSSIDIINNKSQDINIKAGNASMNNIKNIIRAYNNVYISKLDNKNSFIRTNSFIWDLKESIINMNSALDINFYNSTISSSYGSYDIASSILNINNNIYNKSIFNSNGSKKYTIEIISDNAKWIKKNNTLEFKSDNKQVETTIKFLSIK